MKKDVITTEIVVKENKIGIMRVWCVNYKEKERTDYIIQNWMRTSNTILF